MLHSTCEMTVSIEAAIELLEFLKGSSPIYLIPSILVSWHINRYGNAIGPPMGDGRK